MAVLERRHMGVVAAAAVAVATCGAAAAGGGAAIGPLDVPLVVLAVALAGGVVGVASRASTKVLPAGKDVVVLTAVTVGGFVGLYLVGWTTRDHEVEIARLLPLAVVALSVLWPEPNVLRYCLLLAAGTLLGTAGGQTASRPAVGGAVVALAVALVATNRLTAASGPRLGEAPPARGRRVAAEAVAVLAIVGLLAALAAALLPPRDPSGGRAGGRDGALPRPAAPPMEGEDDLDVTAGTDAPSEGFVLLVDASKPDMWRVMTYDHWDGESWSRSPEDVVVVARDFVEPGVGDLAVAPGPRSRDRLQLVTLLAESATVLAAAARPTHVSSEGDVGQGADASLYPRPPLSRGDRYLVFSDRSQAPGRVLRAIGDPPAAAVPSDVARSYLQLPQVAARVRALAAEVTAGESSTYGRVRAIEGWIDDHTTVTADTAPVTTGVDPLEAFLFDERPGSSEQAATSMAVMLRALGIPARIAVGFLPGTRTGSDPQFLVRSRDAHAWVEVWFPTAGWQRFDPTGKAPDAHAEESVWDRLLRFLSRLWPLVLLVVLVAGGWLAWRGVRWWRRRAALPWATRFFSRVERAGAARGRPRRPQETPVEYAGELADGVLPDPRIVEVGELVTVAAWSRREPPADDRARAERVLREAARASPVRRLRRLRGRGSGSRPAPRPTIAKP
ncbi:MAG: FIG001454: Transglutaminase-like enzymes, putative cysteine proteases [uncultured Acidimicrobiales bacterium]|uniref:FIG001454: Transglutaminase-like enzymes, putative cysteine proteases n=1 Tax=uncultured Acidimicrobiales bacterium TaxID=310071 RepID=A0A6J4ITB1_9ACTN|nr:MAG: FIG001454: Transglutaminase-like enzymes, putative cysteine proteases [uncultured Acidimicrobiales bacterium]